MLNYRRAVGVEGGSLFKPDNALSYKNYPLSLRLFYENAAIKVRLHITLYTSYNDRTNLHLFSATWRAYLKTWFNFGIAADITTSKYDFSSTLLTLNNQFSIKSTKVLIGRDFGNTTYIGV